MGDLIIITVIEGEVIEIKITIGTGDRKETEEIVEV